MIGNMWSYFIFYIFDDVVTVAGCVIINVLSCKLFLTCYLFMLKIQIFGESL